MALDPNIILSGTAGRAPIEGPIDQYAKAIQLKSLLQAQQQSQAEAPLRMQALQQNVQAGQQDIAAKQDALATQAATRKAYQASVKPNAQGQPEIDTDSLTQNLAQSGHGDAIPGILENVNKFQKSKADLTEQAQKIQTGQSDTLGYAAKAIQNAKYDPNVAHTILDTFPHSPQIDAMRQQIDTNPDAFKQIVDNAISQSPAQQKAAEEEKVAQIRAAGKPAEKELPLSNPDQMNQALRSRFNVLHPNQPLPPQFTLPANATQGDYDRIDKSLGAVENAEGTKAQRDISNQMRLDAAANAKGNKGTEPVMAFDANNKAHLLAEGDAKDAGYTGITKATPKQIDDAKTHRVVLNDMPTKLNDAVDSRGALDQGVIQRGIISKVLEHAEPGLANDAVRATLMKGATDQTKQYVQNILSLRESALGLPKEITGGSRVSEIQSNALFQTLPSGASVDSKYALDQANKFQANIDRLNDRVPEVRGMTAIAKHADLGGKGGGSAQASAAVPANVAKALASTGPGVHTLSDGSKWMKNADGSVTKQP
jgi:hypothetical protein